MTVIAWGEFGRTPRINKDAGRDHWPQVSCALLAGGGMRRPGHRRDQPPGRVRQGPPGPVQEVFATLYHNLGIDVAQTTITDPTGRPQYLVESPPLPELV